MVTDRLSPPSTIDLFLFVYNILLFASMSYTIPSHRTVSRLSCLKSIHCYRKMSIELNLLSAMETSVNLGRK